MSSRFILFGVFAISCAAQDLRGISSVRGEVVSDDSLAGNRLVVDLADSISNKKIARAFVGSDGSFEFRDVPAGTYSVAVGNSSGDPIQQETVDLRTSADRIEIHLPAPANKPKGVTGTVSVFQLQHPLSPKSVKLFEAASKASLAGDYLKQIQILRRALNDPSAAPFARTNIGAAYIKAGQPALAVPELQEAVRLAANDAVMHSNLAYALLLTRQIDAAEAECRRALQIDGNNSKARWLLGSILLNQGTHEEEAEEDLRAASRELPTAKVILAQFYERTGRKDAAARELREYLSQASNEDRVKVEQWLSRLGAK